MSNHTYQTPRGTRTDARSAATWTPGGSAAFRPKHTRRPAALVFMLSRGATPVRHAQTSGAGPSLAPIFTSSEAAATITAGYSFLATGAAVPSPAKPIAAEHVDDPLRLLPLGLVFAVALGAFIAACADAVRDTIGYFSRRLGK